MVVLGGYEGYIGIMEKKMESKVSRFILARCLEYLALVRLAWRLVETNLGSAG